MLDLLLVILFIFGIIKGLKRGFILQFFHLIGFIIAFLVAKIYGNSFAEKLVLWVPYPNLGGEAPIELLFDGRNLEMAYYRGIAFVIVFFAAKFVMRVIGSTLNFIAHLPFLKQINKLAGAFFGFLEVYLIAFIVLFFASLIPLDGIQASLQDSVLPQAIIKHTPFLSQYLMELWIDA
jgi:uncharacterized membrane protein required for colicin V production